MVTTWSLPGHSARQTPGWSSIGHPGVTRTTYLHNFAYGWHKSWIGRHLSSVASIRLPAVGLPSDLAKGPLFSGTDYRRFISRFRAMAAKWEQQVPSSKNGSSPCECFWRETGLSLRFDLQERVCRIVPDQIVRSCGSASKVGTTECPVWPISAGAQMTNARRTGREFCGALVQAAGGITPGGLWPPRRGGTGRCSPAGRFSSRRLRPTNE